MTNSYGVDLGTKNLKIYVANSKSIINVKNTIAVVEKNKMYAYGDEAYSMFEKAPDMINVSFPVVSGVIADFDNMQTMLFEILEQNKCKINGAEFIVTVPTDITEVEKKAFHDLLMRTKNKPKTVLLCEKPIADAIGMGLDVTEPTGIMVVDCGADTTEISVVSLGGLVITELLPFGGNNLDQSIVTHMKRNYNLLIGHKTACDLKENIGSATGQRNDKMTVVGRDVVSGLPIEMEITSQMVYDAMKSDLESLCNSIRIILEKVPPELAKDIVASGIYLTGGSAGIFDIAELFNDVTGIKVNVSEDMNNTTALGLSKVIHESKYNRFGYGIKTRIFK